MCRLYTFVNMKKIVGFLYFSLDRNSETHYIRIFLGTKNLILGRKA